MWRISHFLLYTCLHYFPHHFIINANTYTCLHMLTYIVLEQEANNLKNRNSLRFNGLVHSKTVGIEAASDGKGVVLVTRNNNCEYNFVRSFLQGNCGIAN